MPTDTNDTQVKNPLATDTTAVNAPAPASAPGAAPMPDAPVVGQMPTDMPAADAPKADETIVPGVAPVADEPTVSQLPTDLPKAPEEGTNTGNQGGIPPATTGM